MKIVFTDNARKQLRGISRERAMQILHRLTELKNDPADPSLDVAALHGRNDFRLRVGTYRIVFDIVGEEIVVTAVGARQGIYKK